MSLETLIFGNTPLVLTEHERSEIKKLRTHDLLRMPFVFTPIFGFRIVQGVLPSSASASMALNLYVLVLLGIGVPLAVWSGFERARIKSTHRLAFVEALKSGLRVCTKCEYPLPAEPLEGVCSECGCPYNPETLQQVWTERYGKLADVEPSAR